MLPAIPLNPSSQQKGNHVAEPTNPNQVTRSIREIIIEMARRLLFTFTKDQILDAFGITEKMREDDLLDVDFDVLEQHLRNLHGLPGAEPDPDPDPDDPPPGNEEAAPRCSGFRVKDGVVTDEPCNVKGAGNLVAGQNGQLYCKTPSHLKQGDVITDPREMLRIQLTQPRVDVPLESENPRRVANIVPDGRGGGDYPSVMPGDKDVHVGPQMLNDETRHMPHVSTDKRKELDELLRQLPDFDPDLDEDRVSKVRTLLILGREDIATFNFRDWTPPPSRTPRPKRGGGRPPASAQAPSARRTRPAASKTTKTTKGSAAVDLSQLEECIRALLQYVDVDAPEDHLNMSPDPDVFADMCVAAFSPVADPDEVRELALAVQE